MASAKFVYNDDSDHIIHLEAIKTLFVPGRKRKIQKLFPELQTLKVRRKLQMWSVTHGEKVKYAGMKIFQGNNKIIEENGQKIPLLQMWGQCSFSWAIWIWMIACTVIFVLQGMLFQM